jgi:hypothetical protein
MAQRVLRVLRRLPRMVWRRENIPVAAVAGQRASHSMLRCSSTSSANRFHALSQAWRSSSGGLVLSDARKVGCLLWLIAFALLDCCC